MKKLNRQAKKALKKIDLDFDSYGYYVLGPILYGFAAWLGDTAEKQQLSHIYFLARDGYNVKKAYDLISYDHPNWPQGSYLYASRRAFYVPLLASCKTYEETLSIMSDRSSWNAQEFVEALGLQKNVLPKWMDAKKLVYREELPKSVEFKKLFEQLRPQIVKESQAEYDSLSQYLVQEGVPLYAGKRVGIVDIGWNGSMQTYLSRLLHNIFGEQSCLPFGMYLGLTTKAQTLGSNAEAYWFDNRISNQSFDPITPFKGLLELFFSNEEGSTDHFIKVQQGNNILAKPVLKQYEYSGTSALEQEKSNLESLRTAALRYVKTHTQINKENSSAESSMSLITSLGLHPSLKQAKFFGDLLFEDGDIAPLAKPQKISKYLMHPSMLKSDLLESRWKVGFLKRLFLLPGNYYQLYSFLSTMRG